MVYSSIPAYLDPANWQQQPQPPNHQQTGGINGAGASSHLLQPPLPRPLPPQPHGGGGAGSIRPGSMADRARMANIPMPEAALKCPRCDSTNTKFCYFNNYSLSQPRHFCKTCRRYWTRGGALRSVPVGGGCRRNKRSKAGGSTSKSPAASGDLQTCSSGSTNSITSSGPADHIFGLGPLRFMAPLHNFSDLGGGGEINYNIPCLVGTGNNDMNFHSLNSGTGASLLGLGGGAMEQQWRLHQQQPQFPFLDASAAALYPFDQQGGGEGCSTFVGQNQLRPKAPVKVEDSHHHHHQHNQDHQQMSLLGNITGNDQFWSGGVGSGTSNNAWTDLSGFSSSSASHP